MAKICKSCGNYYDGDYCDKCGYGKKNVRSKAAQKYKKATKPERFRTEEDKALYAKWEKEKREEKAKRRRDPKAGIKLLVIVAVVVVGVIFLALYKSGAIFSDTRTEVVENYFNAIRDGDYDKFLKCFPTEIKNDYESERRTLGLSKEKYFSQLYADFDETYGSGYTISVEFGKETELGADDYDMTDYKAAYGSAPNLSEVYEMVVNVTFSGPAATESAKLYINVGKASGKWRIFGITEDVGIVNEETGLQQPEETASE